MSTWDQAIIRIKDRYQPSRVAEYLAKGRRCMGPVCTETDPKGLIRTKESFNPGMDICQTCQMNPAKIQPRGVALIEEKPVKVPPKYRHKGKELGPRIVQPDDPNIRICTKCKQPRDIKTHWTESTLRRYMPCRACRNARPLHEYRESVAKKSVDSPLPSDVRLQHA